MPEDELFGDIRSLVHELAHRPERVDHALWAMCQPNVTTRPWHAYLRDGLAQIALGPASLLDYVDWFLSGRSALWARVDSLQHEVPSQDRLTHEDLDVFLCVVLWNLVRRYPNSGPSQNDMKGDVMFARRGVYVYFQARALEFSTLRGSFIPGLMADTGTWPGLSEWVHPPEEMSASFRAAPGDTHKQQ